MEDPLLSGRRRNRAPLRGGEQIEIYPFVFRFEVEFDVDVDELPDPAGDGAEA